MQVCLADVSFVMFKYKRMNVLIYICNKYYRLALFFDFVRIQLVFIIGKVHVVAVYSSPQKRGYRVRLYSVKDSTSLKIKWVTTHTCGGCSVLHIVIVVVPFLVDVSVVKRLAHQQQI